MKKNHYTKLLCFTIFFLSYTANAQNKKYPFTFFKSSRLTKALPHTYFDRIEFIDSREDTGHLGFHEPIFQFNLINPNFINRRKELSFDPYVAEQLTTIFNKAKGKNAEDATLVYQLHKFYICDVSNDSYHYNGEIKNEIVLRANFYLKKNYTYYLLSRIDTVIERSFSRFLGATLNKARAAITQPMLQCMTTSYDTSFLNNTEQYTLQEVMNIAKKDAKKFPVFANKQLQKGVYYTYTAFKNQLPDDSVSVVYDKNDAIDYLTKVADDGTEEKVRHKKVYAVVIDGKAYYWSRWNNRKNGLFHGKGLGYLPITIENERMYISGRMYPLNVSTNVALKHHSEWGIKVFLLRFPIRTCMAEIDNVDGTLLFRKIEP